MPHTITKGRQDDMHVVNRHLVHYEGKPFGTLHQVGGGFPNSGQWVWYTPHHGGDGPSRGSAKTFEEAKAVLERCLQSWLEREG